MIDAPTLIHLVRDGVGVHPDHQLVAPNLIRSQASTLLLEWVRSDALSREEALDVVDRVAEVNMRVLNDRVSRRKAWQIAHEQCWPTVFDAEYVAVCRLQADALVTIDDAFTRRIEGLVPIEPISALSSPTESDR